MTSYVLSYLIATPSITPPLSSSLITLAYILSSSAIIVSATKSLIMSNTEFSDEMSRMLTISAKSEDKNFIKERDIIVVLLLVSVSRFFARKKIFNDYTISGSTCKCRNMAQSNLITNIKKEDAGTSEEPEVLVVDVLVLTMQI